MGDRALPSESDSSDEDYVPEGKEKEPLSEDESGNDSNEPEEGSDEENGGKNTKRKKTPRKKSRKKLKSAAEETEEKEKPNYEKEEQPEMTPEDKKQRANALWADFLKDCDPPVKKKSDISKTNLENNEMKKSTDKKIVEEYEFAGEKVLIEKKIPVANGTVSSSAPPATPIHSLRGKGRGRGGGSGIASILGQIGKKNKLSTLEKSKLDWDLFKKDEGIEEELEQHNKGKNGYLERQDFLERADLRQFEMEKTLRAVKRSSLR